MSTVSVDSPSRTFAVRRNRRVARVEEQGAEGLFAYIFKRRETLAF